MDENSKPLNPGLYRLHTIFFFLVTAGAMTFVLFALSSSGGGGSDNTGGLVGVAIIAAILLAEAVMHYFAAQGAKAGKPYGKTLTRIFGTLWLFAVPIGTILGIYALSKISDENWKGGAGGEG